MGLLQQDHPVGIRFRQFVRTRHRQPLVRRGASLAEAYLRAYYNEDHYNFDQNGERFVLQALGSQYGSRPLVVWDVGAHEGGWSELARCHLPAAEVHSMEVVPRTRQKLEQLACQASWLHVHPFGLSDRAGAVTVTVNSLDNTLAALHPRRDHWTFRSGSLATVEATVEVGDELVERGDLPTPDVVKIDVEGHEVAVMRGMSQLFSGTTAPLFVQFEYGSTFIEERTTLYEIHRMLGPNGYAIGRVYPEHVAFGDYRVEDEHYRMGNYVAVRDAKLQSELAGS